MKNFEFICIVICMAAMACGRKNGDSETTSESWPANTVILSPKQIARIGIEIDPIDKQNVSSVLKLNGKVEVPPQNLISISAPMGGYLKFTHLLNGMKVKKGEVLAVMQDLQYIQWQQDYLTAKAQFSLVESEYYRQKELNQAKAASDKAFEQANANYQSQLILIKSLEEKLKMIGINPKNLTHENISATINLYSPVNGFVSKVNVNTGKYVAPGEVLFELINPSDIHLSLTVFEKDIDKLSIGQKLIAYTNSQPDKKHHGEIILISRSIENNNAAQVHCHFEQYNPALLPGIFMNAEVEWNSKNTFALPTHAIVRYNGKYFGFVAKNDTTFEMVELIIGNEQRGYTQVLNTENFSGQSFVTKGAYDLLMIAENTSDE